MRVHWPRTTSKPDDSIIANGVLRDVWNVRDDLWQIKVSLPKISMVDNLYLSLNDQEIEMIVDEWRTFKESPPKEDP